MKEFLTTSDEPSGCIEPHKPSNKTQCKVGWGELTEDVSSCNISSSIKSKCKCYPNYDLNTMKACSSDNQTDRLKKDQFCAFVDDEDNLIPCGAGCCDGGCPGQNCYTDPKDPEPLPSGTIQSRTEDNTQQKVSNTINFIVFLVLVLLVFSTFALFLRDLKNTNAM